MIEHLVGSVCSFEDNGKRVVVVNGVEIGVFQVGGTFYAWRNVCPHQGGPVCQGRIFKKVIENIDSERKTHGRSYDENVLHIVCPWHGGEFNIRTGYHAGTNRLALTPIQIIVRNGEVFLRVD